MKKFMLGTTALIAASALTAGAASAAEKIKLNVGGYMASTFIFVDYDEDDDQHDTRIQEEGEVIFSGSTTLDNGITFGVNIQLEARQSGDQVDETFVYASGAFGRVNFGAEDSAAYLMHHTSPTPVPHWAADSANGDVIGHGHSTRPNEIGDADKITYFTPRFSGFQLGASYVPDADCETGSKTGCGPYNALLTDTDEGTAWSVGANYVNSFDDVGVNVSLTYQTIQWDESSATDYDTEELAVGGNVSFAGFTVGAGWKNSENDGGVEGNDRDHWSLGVKYGQGPWSVGIQYANAEWDIDGGGGADGLEADMLLIGGQYNLGPGVAVFGGVQFHDIDSGYGASEEGDSEVYLIGTALSF